MKYVFRKGQCVRSKLYGSGQALTVGETPLIRFLDGREIEMKAGELVGVPDDRLEAEIANRSAIECWMLVRAHGGAWLDSGGPWIRDDDGTWILRSEKSRRDAEPAPGVEEYFLPDEIGGATCTVDSAD